MSSKKLMHLVAKFSLEPLSMYDNSKDFRTLTGSTNHRTKPIGSVSKEPFNLDSAFFTVFVIVAFVMVVSFSVRFRVVNDTNIG